MGVITHNKRCRVKIDVTMLLIILIMLAQIGHAQTYETLANYNFHGMSAGTNTIPCTIDSLDNHDWEFVSKSQASLLVAVSINFYFPIDVFRG